MKRFLNKVKAALVKALVWISFVNIEPYNGQVDKYKHEFIGVFMLFFASFLNVNGYNILYQFIFALGIASLKEFIDLKFGKKRWDWWDIIATVKPSFIYVAVTLPLYYKSYGIAGNKIMEMFNGINI